MIDYRNLDNYYTGIMLQVLTNAGGTFLELGPGTQAILYKIDDDHYVDVNTRGIVEILRDEVDPLTSFVAVEETLTQVTGKNQITSRVSLTRRLLFDPSKYGQRGNRN